jgi:hypothetical protein
MEKDSADTLTWLLSSAKAAHGVYEATELAGVYDAQWPRWYAAYLIEHGATSLLGRDVTVDQLAQALEASWEAQRQEGVSPDEWSAFTARHIATEFEPLP